MDIKRIAAISLFARQYDSLGEKLAEAIRWVSMAGRLGADLAVLPEAINVFYAEGPEAPPAGFDFALTDWRESCASLLACAQEHGLSLALPLIVHEDGARLNCFYLIGSQGEVLGRYAKRYPTPGELEKGTQPGGVQPLIEWGGLKVGGAICFDLNFPQVVEDQAERGAQLFLCPSLFPGGDQMNDYARRYRAPFVLAYPAWSRIVDSIGRDVVEGGYRNETLRFGYGVPVYIAELNFDIAHFFSDHNQQQIEAILRHYGPDVDVHFSQRNTVFTIASRSPDFTVADVIRRFNLIPHRQYFSDCGKLVDSPRG